jgi:PIN domain nuclease of toxin-antitoxin system
VRILLDTQCWLWMQASPRRFSRASLDLLDDPENELVFSAASSWEIAIKYALGRLPLPERPSVYVPDRMASSGVLPLSVGHAHALHVATLPSHHRDPFDRLLIAQAQILGLRILTADDAFEPYDVEIERAT